MSVKFTANGLENGHTAWLVSKRLAGAMRTVASIVFEDGEWILRTGNRIDRFELLGEAKAEARKI